MYVEIRWLDKRETLCVKYTSKTGTHLIGFEDTKCWVIFSTPSEPSTSSVTSRSSDHYIAGKQKIKEADVATVHEYNSLWDINLGDMDSK